MARLIPHPRARSLPSTNGAMAPSGAAIMAPSPGATNTWLNLAETLFGKMARTFLKHIRVKSLEELHQRILKGINEINEMPVVHRWKAFQALEKTDMI